MTVSTGSGEASVSSSGNLMQSPRVETPPIKKKRNLPGMPDPEAEVVALSPKTLMATNRFICEICKKGFQRDQNLQLHRRGHNLPWKLRQRTSKEAPKRVYVCPEVSCVHNDPARALGDLTGIKKHFCRKHGEKKFQCEKCSKKYAVQSDWKAHSKICGTKEYRCFCGTLFSRRDSYITHRAFCDALAEETAMKLPSQTLMIKSEKPISEIVTEAQFVDSSSPPPSPQPDSAPAASPLLLIHNSDFAENSTPQNFKEIKPRTTAATTCLQGIISSSSSTSISSSGVTHGGLTGTVFASLFASSTASPALQTTSNSNIPAFLEPISLCLSSPNQTSIFEHTNNSTPSVAPPPAAMSATALLQKAAEMGVAATNSSLLRGFGIMPSSSPCSSASPLFGSSSASCTSASSLFGDRESFQWAESSGSGLNLELGRDDGSGLKGLLFGPTQTTLDLLGPSLTWMTTPMGSGDLDMAGEFVAGKDEMMGRRR